MSISPFSNADTLALGSGMMRNQPDANVRGLNKRLTSVCPEVMETQISILFQRDSHAQTRCLNGLAFFGGLIAGTRGEALA